MNKKTLWRLLVLLAGVTYETAYAAQKTTNQTVTYKGNKITIMLHDSADGKVTWKKCSLKGDTLRCPYKGAACKGTPNPYTMKLTTDKKGNFFGSNNLTPVQNGTIISLFVLEPNPKDTPPTTCYTPYYSVAN